MTLGKNILQREQESRYKYCNTHWDMVPCFYLDCSSIVTVIVIIAFLVHFNQIGIQINHSKIQFNKLFSLVVQFNKIEIQTHFQNFIIKCVFALTNCVL